MFATEAGPTLLSRGEAFIEISGTVKQWSDLNRSVEVIFATYLCDEEKYEQSLSSLCGSSTAMVQVLNPWVHGLGIKRFSVGKFVNQSPLPSRLLLANDTIAPSAQTTLAPSMHQHMLFQWAVDVDWRFPVKVEGWQTAVIALCGEDSLAQVEGRIEGKIGFRNPYGYIQADSYGILPFEAARMVAVLLLGLFLVTYYYCLWNSVVALHKAVMTVYLFALCESIVWFTVYQRLNETGEPYCCPFPPLVVGSLVLQVFRQTLSRALLLVVAQGYSIARPELNTFEWFGVAAVAILYFSASLGAQVTEIVNSGNFQHPGSVSSAPQIPSLMSQLPALVMDALFLTWIFAAFHSTHRVLKEHGQTHKLGIYNTLYASLAFFAILFCITAILFFLDQHSIINLPWQLTWTRQASWETLNFAVLVTISLVSLPSERTRMFAYSSQLPTEDPDEFADSLPSAEDDNDGTFSRFSGILGGSKYTSAEEDSEDFDFDGKPMTRSELEMSTRPTQRSFTETDELESG